MGIVGFTIAKMLILLLQHIFKQSGLSTAKGNKAMKHLIAAFAAIIATMALYSTTSISNVQPLDTGSCYSVKPICLGNTTLVCLCSYNMTCYWACKGP